MFSLKYTSIALREVSENDFRLEAGFFGIDGRQARERITKCRYPIVKLSEKFIEDIFYLERFKRTYVEKKNGVPLILPSQITEIHPQATKFIAPKASIDIKSMRVKRGQILMTRSGTIGIVSYVSDTLDGMTVSDDVIRIELKEYPGYVYAFLNSKTGRLLVETNNYGAVIKHIEPKHLSAIPIPNPPKAIKKKIHELVESSFKLRDESNKLMDEAQKLLKEALQLPSIEELQENIKYFYEYSELQNYSVPLAKLNDRFDGSYHIPIVEKIENHIRKYAKEITTIGDTRVSQSIVLPNRFKRTYVQEGAGTILMGGKSLYSPDPNDKKYLSLGQYRKDLRDELVIEENMIIISAKGTPGKVVISPEYWEGRLISDNLIKLTPSSKDIAGFLYCYLSSPYGQLALKRQIHGGVVDVFEPVCINSITVPLCLDNNIQTLINTKVLDANKKRTEAYRMGQKALTIMNDEVIHSSSNTPIS